MSYLPVHEVVAPSSAEYFPASHGMHPEPRLYSPAGHEREHVLLDKGGDLEEVGVKVVEG